MRKFYVAAVVAVLLATSTANAGPLRNLVQGVKQRITGACAAPVEATSTTAASSTATTSGSTAQRNAEIQAARGGCFHPGGLAPGATHEGVGFSTVSADHAIRSCCYWGRLTPIEIGVARGANGWHAAVQYGSPRPLQTLVQGTVTTLGNTVQQTGQVITNVGTRLTTPCANNQCPSPTVTVVK